MSTLKTNNIQHVDRSDPSIIINTDGSVNIAGTMTYEDVTNVDAVGIITGRSNIDAQKQVHVGTGVSVKAGGLNVTAGITTVQALQATTGNFSSNVDVAGELTVAETIAHTGDTNNKISFPAADTITLTTSGSERLRIASDGKVGVNTTAGSGRLTADASSGYAIIANGDSTGIGLGSNGVIVFGNKNVAAYASGTIDAADISFKTSNTERLSITSGGKVNIGGDYTNTTSTLRVIGDSSGGSQTYLEKSSGSTNNTYNSVLTLSSRSTGSAASNYGPAIGFQHAFGASNYAGALIASQCNSDVNTADLVFYPRNYGYTEALRINSSGHLVMSRATTAELIQLTTTNNSTRAVIAASGKDSSGNAVTIKIGGFGDTQRGEIFTHSNHDLGFATNNAAAQFKMKTGGNFEIVNGDLKLASGHGIDFSATGQAASPSSEILDDYEEGTWTFAIVPGGGSYQYNYGQTGYYRKVGNTVFINAWIHLVVSSSTSGGITLTGLPFTVQNRSRNWISVGGYGHSSVSNSSGLWMIVTPNATTASFTYNQITYAGSTNLTAGNLGTSSELYINGSYFTDS